MSNEVKVKLETNPNETLQKVKHRLVQWSDKATKNVQKQRAKYMKRKGVKPTIVEMSRIILETANI